MSSIDQLPPERDLPADRHARMRTRVLATIGEPAAPRRTATGRLPVRIAAAGLATAACVAIAWVGIGGRSGSDHRQPKVPEVYALGDGALSPRVREAGRQCLDYARRDDRQLDPQAHLMAPVTWPADSPPQL